MTLSIHSLYSVIFRIWRRRRFALFESLLQPQSREVLLDVGGYPGTWTEHPQKVRQIDSLNVHEVVFDQARFPNHHIRTLVGDGCALQFPDQSYDIVFSNSVIEHVGDWDRQKAFAAEVRRVGGRLWVQTPAYGCPIEPHYLAPFVHWLPIGWRPWVIRWLTPRGWLDRPSRETIREMVATTRLLKRKEVLELFPDCQLLVERLLWILPKSYILYRTKAPVLPADRS